MKKSITRLITTILLICFFISAQAEVLLQLGESSYSRSPARSLTKPVSIKPGFFRAVGGVAFDSVAVGRGGLVVIALEYNEKQPDGRRLIVTVSNPTGDKQRLCHS